MAKRITALTAEQRGRMDEWAAKWIAIGLSTERADFDAFEVAARACYRYAGLPEPRVVVRTTSPLALALAAPTAAALRSAASVDDSVDDSVLASVAASVRASVRASVADSVAASVDASVGASVLALPPSRFREAIRANWHRYIGGQFWVGGWWGSPAFVSFFQDVCGLELPGDLGDRARAYQQTASSAGWWWPGQDFIMVSDRPLAIHRDDAGRLHSESGKAIVWPDGWGVYSWHGVRVPAEVIETPPEAITIERIAAEQNAEVRRVLMSRMGIERYLSLSKASPVNRDDWGTLWAIEAPVPMRVVELVNSTPEPDGTSKLYFIRVPETAERRDPDRCVACGTDLARVPQTAHEAVAWSYSSCASDYRPMVQT